MEMTDVSSNHKIIKPREKSSCIQNLIHKSCPEKGGVKKSHGSISSALSCRPQHQAEEKKLCFWASAELSYCYGACPSRDPGGPLRALEPTVLQCKAHQTFPSHLISRSSWEKKWTWISLLLQLSCREINIMWYIILIIFINVQTYAEKQKNGIGIYYQPFCLTYYVPSQIISYYTHKSL